MTATATPRLPIVILISGRGSNLEAIIRCAESGALDVDIRAVISNRPDAAGLAVAATAGIPAEVIDHTAYANRAAFERALRLSIDTCQPGLVVLAGFMRLLTAGFVAHYHGRMLNIHPSLLPALPGLDTHRRALDAVCANIGAEKMPEPSMPALEDLGDRHFSFYPAILNIEHNEWILKRTTSAPLSAGPSERASWLRAKCKP